MTKFKSSYSSMEVCCVAKCLPAYLNRQVILMLDSHGVPKQVSLLSPSSPLLHSISLDVFSDNSYKAGGHVGLVVSDVQKVQDHGIMCQRGLLP